MNEEHQREVDGLKEIIRIQQDIIKAQDKKTTLQGSNRELSDVYQAAEAKHFCNSSYLFGEANSIIIASQRGMRDALKTKGEKSKHDKIIELLGQTTASINELYGENESLTSDFCEELRLINRTTPCDQQG